MFWPFKRYDVEMSPPIVGRITDSLTGVEGITVHRVLIYEGYEKGKSQRTSIVTDSEGRFYFPELIVRSKAPGDIFGQNLSVYQGVYLDKGSDVTYLWSTNKTPDSLPTLTQLLSNLECDINSVATDYELDLSNEGGRRAQVISSICQWGSGRLKSTTE